jgi:anti-sigma factor RsiW
MTDDPMACEELVELVTAYLDRALDAPTRARFDAHIGECDGCDAFLQQFRVTIDTMSRTGSDELDPALRSKLLDVFHHWS